MSARYAFLATMAIAYLGVYPCGADWPQYRCDATRGSYTPEDLPSDLALHWEWQPHTPPDPAWRGLDTRMPFDHAYHVVADDTTVFFGSSTDCTIRALRADSGEARWSFTTDGPVRFAPVLWHDRLFALSDDGRLYALGAGTGNLLWQMRGGPAEDMLLGNGRMISRWPARGGLAIMNDVLYFGAGIWPSEGIYLYALDPVTGEILWANTDSGDIEMDQPHPTAWAKSGLSAQGYLTVCGDRLLVPTGRAIPAALNLADGRFLYFHLQQNRAQGGSALAAAAPWFLNRGYVFASGDGATVGPFPYRAVAVSPNHVVVAREGQLTGFRREDFVVEQETLDRKGNKAIKKALAEPEWAVPIPVAAPCSLIVAGAKAVVGGEDGAIAVADLAARSATPQVSVKGRPLGLAAAGGRLYVSTDSGSICCFAAGASDAPAIVGPAVTRAAYREGTVYETAADQILTETGIRDGYCIDLGCGKGQLAYELARRSALRIYAVDSDPANVRLARERLMAAGLYGARVTVHCADPAATPYADYCADLVVSGRSLRRSVSADIEKEAQRLRRPWGGVACLGKPGNLRVDTRGALPGAGAWTHQYATPANTCCSGDQRVKAPLSMLWFRDADFVMPSRHGRGPAPLFNEGRLFVEGMNGIRALNAYNGRVLWEYAIDDVLKRYDQEHLVGTAGTNSNMCLENDVLYVAVGGECRRLNTVTGELLGTLQMPAEESGTDDAIWGYIACEGGTLFGTRANADHVVKWTFRESDMSELFTESSAFFAMNAATGELKWQFTPEHSLRHNAIAIGDGRVFLIDRPLDTSDRLDYDAEAAKRRGEVAPPPPAEQAELLALDMDTGQTLWRTKGNVYGTLLALSIEHDILLMTQQHTRFKLRSEKGGRMTAFRASTGERLWDVPSDPRGKAARPVLNGRVLYNEPGAWDLVTGERLNFELERSYGCGIISSGENILLYRSATFGYYDLLADEGTINYGGIRPGCWINLLPVGGLVLAPDATERCTCSYLIKSTVALQPAMGGRGGV